MKNEDYKLLLCIIYINYNTEILIKESIESLKKYIDIENYLIVIVNNGTDKRNEIEKLGNIENVKVIWCDKNIGFGPANNLAIKSISAKYYLLLNPDTIIFSKFINCCISEFESNRDIGALGIYLKDVESRISLSYGKFPTYKSVINQKINIIIKRKNIKFESNEIIKKDVDYITGADLFIPRSVIDNVGEFNEKMFLYCEEVELQRRIKNAGFTVRILPITGIIHLEGKSHKNLIRKKVLQEIGYIKYFENTEGHSSNIFKYLYITLSIIEGIERFLLNIWNVSNLKEYFKYYLYYLNKD